MANILTVPIVGNAADRGAAAAYKGKTFFALDTGDISYSDGSTWSTLPSSGSSGAAASEPFATFGTTGGLSAEVDISGKKIAIAAYSDANFTSAVLRPQLFNFLKDTPPTSANAMDDEFDDSTGMSGTINGTNARWTARNTPNALAYTTQGYAKLTVPASSGHHLRGYTQAFSGDGTYDMKISVHSFATTTVGGLWLLDAVINDSYLFDWISTGANIGFRVDKYSSLTAVASTPYNPGTLATAFLNAFWMRFINVGTAFSWWISADGLGWLRLYNETDTISPTTIGFAMDEQSNTTNPIMYIDYFRKVA